MRHPHRQRRKLELGEVGPPFWAERPVFIVGGGTSLKGRDLSRLRDRGWVLGVNRAAEFIPVDATFSLDTKFAREYGAQLAEWAKVHQVYLTVPPDFGSYARIVPGVIYLSKVSMRGLSLNQSAITGLNSGYGALNLAVLKRAREIVLLGFDLTPPPVPADRHWHSGYAWDRGQTATRTYPSWADRFRDVLKNLPSGVTVTNANPASAIKAFPFATYEEFGL